ncbi:hypothetical protein X765_19960 [Mesorhizobium sp. LSHC440B00]|nr:hypothetical protein X765_19960 [Mesorhizobium sp. LSHC440B00]ESX36484.1 hypothetical protein X763_14270 [Mesorhizobium sp. LSHC432A00]ESX41892.1 hypothetical protein X764_13090 [Mesorhizobium sp. LSHC440A00]
MAARDPAENEGNIEIDLAVRAGRDLQPLDDVRIELLPFWPGVWNRFGLQLRAGNVDQFHDLMVRNFFLWPARTTCRRRSLVGFQPNSGSLILVLGRLVVFWKALDVPALQREQSFRALQGRNAGACKHRFGCRDAAAQLLGCRPFNVQAKFHGSPPMAISANSEQKENTESSMPLTSEEYVPYFSVI